MRKGKVTRCKEQSAYSYDRTEYWYRGVRFERIHSERNGSLGAYKIHWGISTATSLTNTRKQTLDLIDELYKGNHTNQRRDT